ncbi:ABC transporter substrate-binding protein [Pseudonocardia sp. NPDC046786]|uniref:ABC transporter substrate-binding protein n=1 Tax=Pseudonocardia sp. NPDC046786 TaxID=3155471 RepID=UPI0033F1A984
MALVLAACGGPAPAATEPETRTVSHPLGEVQVPEEPASILATDEYAALNLLALGVEPAVVYGSSGSEVGRIVLEDAGVTVAPGATFSESPPIEEIIGHAPDMIVMTGGAEMQETYDALSPVAPVVAVPYYDTTWQESLTAAGAAVARTDQAESMIRTLAGRIGAVQAASEPGPTSLSVVAETHGDCCFSAARGTPLQAILQAAGFTRRYRGRNQVPSGSYA